MLSFVGMEIVRRELFSALLVLGLGGCLLESGRHDAVSTTSLDAARIHASAAAPSLPILVLRTSRDEIDLGEAERANVAMIVSVAELDARTLDRARAALLEGLARGVEAGEFDRVLVSLLTDQMAWAAKEVAPRLQRDLDQLSDLLTPEQRRAVIERVRVKLPSWAQTWAADGSPRWLDTWAEGVATRAELADDLAQTSRKWAEKSAANVRAALPHLDAAQKRALAASLRTGASE
jgi:Spy/CpxP family protein refolding chaperone